MASPPGWLPGSSARPSSRRGSWGILTYRGRLSMLELPRTPRPSEVLEAFGLPNFFLHYDTNLVLCQVPRSPDPFLWAFSAWELFAGKCPDRLHPHALVLVLAGRTGKNVPERGVDEWSKKKEKTAGWSRTWEETHSFNGGERNPLDTKREKLLCPPAIGSRLLHGETCPPIKSLVMGVQTPGGVDHSS